MNKRMKTSKPLNITHRPHLIFLQVSLKLRKLHSVSITLYDTNKNRKMSGTRLYLHDIYFVRLVSKYEARVVFTYMCKDYILNKIGNDLYTIQFLSYL